mgnify:CR=1 FL=1
MFVFFFFFIQKSRCLFCSSYFGHHAFFLLSSPKGANSRKRLLQQGHTTLLPAYFIFKNSSLNLFARGNNGPSDSLNFVLSIYLLFKKMKVGIDTNGFNFYELYFYPAIFSVKKAVKFLLAVHLILWWVFLH